MNGLDIGFLRVKRVHFVGIGGIGMSGIAEVLLNLGYTVSGSDLKKTEITERLEKLGAKVYYEHRPENVEGADVVVVSSAIGPSNPEVHRAKEIFIPVIPRAEMLSELMRMKLGIAICGTHGKTTTTSLISTILSHAGFDPTCVIGGRLKSTNSNARLGTGRFLVAEADESDGSFLLLSPIIVVLTNIDLEHLDYYRDIDSIKEAFLNFLNKVPFFGVDIICIDDPHIQSLIPYLRRRYVTYGFSKQADVRTENVSRRGFGTDFSVIFRGENLGRVSLSIPGIHNVQNALAAVATSIELDVPFETVSEALRDFQGIQRRIELKWDGEIKLFDDYAHHPTEIKATLRTLREMFDSRIVVAFQPHRYTRTLALLKDFALAFNDADILLVTEIYAASEPKIDGVSGERLAESIKASGHKHVEYLPSLEEVADRIVSIAKKGDVVCTLGAGDIFKVAEKLKKIWSGE